MKISFMIPSLALRSIRAFRAVVTGIAIWLAAGTAQAAIIVVNTTSDGNVIYPPGQTPPYPLCTLRDAIIAANTNQPVGGCAKGDLGEDTILFDIGIGTPTIRPRTMLPIITEPIIIRGDSFGATRVELDGTDASRFNSLGGVTHGLYLIGGDSTIKNLVINRFNGSGIVFTDNASGILPDPTPPELPDPKIPTSDPCAVQPSEPNCSPGGGIVDPDIPEFEGAGDNNRVYGSFIGTDANGTIALGNGSGNGTAGIMATTNQNIIGSPIATYRNVISGNRGHGLILTGKANWVRGNFIGLDVSGTLPLGNQFDGINIVGGQPPSASGVIGANPYSADPNCGMIFDPATGRILDDRRQCGNRIAFNNGNGITSEFNQYKFLANSIFSNGLLGIDVDLLGVTQNMTNRDRNFPVLTSAQPAFNYQGDRTGTRILGTITPSQGKIIQFFHSPTCDTSSHGEGQSYQGSFKPLTNGSFNVLLPVTDGYVTATSTTGLTSTSEFSACLKI